MLGFMFTVRTPPENLFRYSEGACLRNVEIFARGTHRGKEYSDKDLQDILRNFADFSTGPSPILEVPAVIGHEEPEEQRWLERTDLPAAAYVRDLDTDAGIVKADMDDLADEVVRVLRARRFKKTSAEIYDAPPEGIPGTRDELLAILKRRGIDANSALAEAKTWAPQEQARQESEVAQGKMKRVEPLESIVDFRLRSHLGKMLRRVAFLGADIPQVKRLADIPMPQAHSESRRFARYRPVLLKFSEARPRPQAGTFWIFSEVTPMSREEMLAKLADLGYDASVFGDTVPDEVLAEIIRVHDDTGAGHAEPDGDEGAGAAAPETDVKQLSEYGEEDDLPDAKDDAEKEKLAGEARKMGEKAKRALEKYCGMARDGDADKHDDAYPADDPTKSVNGSANLNTQQGNPADKMSEKNLQTLVNRAVQAAVNRIVKPALGEVQKFSEEQVASQKKLAVESFCESRKKAGKIKPAELDRTDPANLFDRLMRADSRTVVTKFKENGKDLSMTDLDLQMREIDRRKPFTMGDKVRHQDAAPPVAADQLYEKFSEEFKGAGLSKDEIKKAWDATPEEEREKLIHKFGVGAAA